jgi:hypothetical protein
MFARALRCDGYKHKQSLYSAKYDGYGATKPPMEVGSCTTEDKADLVHRLSKHAKKQKDPEPSSDARAGHAVEALIEAPFSHKRAR